jgi:hypothetical protein
MATQLAGRPDRLAQLERVIERGLNTFVAVGGALLEIRDSRLYHQTHKTFDAYCRARWGWGHKRAYDLIDSAQVAKRLVPVRTDISQPVAAALAPLMRVRPEAMGRVLEEALKARDERPAGMRGRKHEVVRLAVRRELGRVEAQAPISEAIERLFGHVDGLASVRRSLNATEAAAAIKVRSRPAFARRLRDVGGYLASIAAAIEEEME